MSYNIEVRLASKNGYDSPEQARIRYGRYSRDHYVAHWWGRPGEVGTHDQTVDYILRQAEAGNMSVNYVVSDSKITMLVPPDDVSWGSLGGNPTGVNVEHDPTLGAEGYKKAGWLKWQLEQRFGHQLSMKRHSDYMGTQCCGAIDINRIQAESDKWERGEYNAAPVTPVAASQPVLTGTTGQTVHLPASVQSWACYKVGSLLRKGTEDQMGPSGTMMSILPAQFGGLTYDVVSTIGDYAVVINTQAYGQVAIWTRDTEAQFAAKPKQLPAAPKPVPMTEEKYTVITTVKGYATANSAVNDTNAIGVVMSGSYFVYNRKYDMLNLTKTKNQPGSWINPADNVKEQPKPVEDIVPVHVEKPVVVAAPAPVIVEAPRPPAPEPVDAVKEAINYNAWKHMNPLMPDRRPVKYRAVNKQPFQIKDLETGRDLGLLQPGMTLTLIGTFDKDGRRYGRTLAANKNSAWPGIPMGMVRVDFWNQFLDEVRRVKVRVIDSITK